MNKFDKLRKEETYYEHPFEQCVVRTEPDDIYGYTTYVKFSGEPEYAPARTSNIVTKSIFQTKPKWITKEEYDKF